MPQLDAAALATLFHDARTHRAWTGEPVDDATLRELWRLTALGPTAMNTVPLRVAFVKSAAAKERLKPCLDAGNVEKTMTAPVTAILAVDLDFPSKLGVLSPHRDLSGVFAGKEAMVLDTATTNGWLEAGYFLMAARALGLDGGPMGGFDKAKVDAAFLSGTAWKSFLLVNLGHGDGSKLFPRAPRLSFEQAARIE